MIVVDTSVWIEYLRATEHPAEQAVQALIASRERIATTEIILMELLAGARSDLEAGEIRSAMLSLEILPLEGLMDFEEAAVLYRDCRRSGETLRTITDCLIAVPTIRARAEILHKDRDFDAIARHSDLRVRTLGSAN